MLEDAQQHFLLQWLGVKVQNALKNEGYELPRDAAKVRQLSDQELLRLPNMGRIGLEKLRFYLDPPAPEGNEEDVQALLVSASKEIERLTHELAAATRRQASLKLQLDLLAFARQEEGDAVLPASAAIFGGQGTSRNKAIWEAHQSGKSMASIAREHGLSKSRVPQIIARIGSKMRRSEREARDTLAGEAEA